MEKPHRSRRDWKRGNRDKPSVIQAAWADHASRQWVAGSGRVGTARDTVDSEWRMACLGTELLMPSDRDGCGPWIGRSRKTLAAIWERRGLIPRVQCIVTPGRPADRAVSIKYNSGRPTLARIDRGFRLAPKDVAFIRSPSERQPNLIESYSRARDCQSKLIRACK